MMVANGAKRAQVAERRKQAIELRLAGVPWERIADELGYASKGAACTDVTRAFRANTEAANKAGEQMLEVEIARLNRIIAAFWMKAMKGDGWAADRILKAQERLHKITGLDAPTKIQMDAPQVTERVLALLEQVLPGSTDDVDG